MNQKFYECKKCGQIVAIVKETKAPLYCCGEPMEEITVNTVDASQEKHVPVYEIKDNVVYVRVGSVDHPMAEEHYIEWISLQTNLGNQRKVLTPGQAPATEFVIEDGEQIEAVYAHCNLHGLWKA